MMMHREIIYLINKIHRYEIFKHREITRHMLELHKYTPEY